MNSGQNVWTFCHNLPHAQTLKNFLRYSVNVGVQSGQSRSLPVRAWISPTLTSCHHQSALAPSCLSFPHPLMLLHNGCRLFLDQSQLTQSCNFRHEKLTLVVFFLSSGDSLPFPICYPGPLWPLFHTTCYQSEMFAHNNWKQKVKCSSYINDQCFIISWKCELFFHFLGTGYNKQLVGCCLWNMSVLHGPYFEMIILKR